MVQLDKGNKATLNIVQYVKVTNGMNVLKYRKN